MNVTQSLTVNEQKQELLEFLKLQDPNENLHSAGFRVLVFMYINGTRKPWIYYTQTEFEAPWEAKLVLPDLNLEFSSLVKIQDVIKVLNV